MTLRRIGQSSITYLSPSKLVEGQLIKGVFVGTTQDEKFGGLKHRFIVENDESLVLNGSGKLDFLMKSVPANTYVELKYLGKKKISSGKMAGKDAHDWECMADLPDEPGPNAA